MTDPFDDAAAAFAEPVKKPQPSKEAIQAEGSAATYARAAEVKKMAKKPRASADEKEAKEAELQAQADAIEDGIYFGLPAEVYHRVRALGSGSLRDIAISPATFWARSWLNPDKPVEEETLPQILGSAYHCARLEPDEFFSRYCRELDKDEELAALGEGEAAAFTGTDIGEALAALGEAKTKAGESVLEKAYRLRDAGFEGMIWPIRIADWEHERGERQPIKPIHWDAIVVDMKRLRAIPDIAAMLSDGFAEVSIFWTDKHGLRCKVRPDYLRLGGWVDFKTFANPNGKRLEKALADAFQYNRYHMQGAHYRDGIEAVRVGGLQLKGDASDAQRKLVAALQLRPVELICDYVFQEKGGIPNLLARQFRFFDVPMATISQDAGASEEAIARAHESTRQRTQLFARAQMDIERSKRDFHLYSQVYAAGEPWAPIEPVGDFSDLDFNSYWLEGKND